MGASAIIAPLCVQRHTTMTTAIPTLPHAMPLMLAALCATGPLGIDMYLPSIPDMALSLNATEGAIQLSLMTFFMGLMLGQLAYGPLSDKYGRKPLIGVGMVIFVLGSIGCALAQSVEQLHVLRLIQGLGGSIGMVIAFAIVKDAFSGTGFGQMVALILAVLGLSPVAAPMIGSVLQALDSWRSIFWALAVYGALVLVALSLWLPETRRAADRAQVQLGRTFHNYGRILKDKRFLPFALALCMGQAGFFAYIAGSASVFISEFGLSPTQFSLLFGVNALGLVAASILTPKMHKRVGVLATFNRMTAAYLAVMAVAVLYLVNGGSTMWVLCTALFAVVTLLGFIMPTGSQLALMHQRQLSGTASALMGSMQFAFGALVSALSGAVARYGSLGLTAVMLACAGLSALICLATFPRTVQAPAEQQHG